MKTAVTIMCPSVTDQPEQEVCLNSSKCLEWMQLKNRLTRMFGMDTVEEQTDMNGIDTVEEQTDVNGMDTVEEQTDMNGMDTVEEQTDMNVWNGHS